MVLFVCLIVLTILFIIIDFTFWHIQKKNQYQDIFFETMVMLFFIIALVIWVRKMSGFETYLMAVALAVLSFGAVANMLDEFFKQPKVFGDVDQYLNLIGMMIFVLAINKDRTLYLQLLNRENMAKNKAEEMGFKYKTLIEKANDAVFLETVEGKILEVNQKACDLLGYTHSEFRNLTVNDIVPGNIQEKLPEIIKEQLAKGGFNIEAENVHKDGTIIPVEVSTSSMKIGKQSLLLAIVRDITERKQAEEKIKKSLHEKEMLLKEIHHRVKNNLQIISSLLYLQTNELKNEHVLNIITESQNRIRSMAMIHEKLYKSKDIARIAFSEYIQDLTTFLYRSYSLNSDIVKLKMDTGDVLLDIDSAIPCGLIINELVTNTLKYAFPQNRKGEINIKFFSKNNKDFEFIISDNGVGLPDNFQLETCESLGLRLVNNLVDQLNGNMEINKEGGTTFRITFSQNKDLGIVNNDN